MISLYFGLPGAGKTTTIAYLAKKFLRNKKYDHVFCNVDMNINGLIHIDKQDLGIYDIRKGVVLYDEAGVDFDNRDFANFSKDLTWFFKFHRHCELDLHIFSQTIDVDKKIRSLANRVFYLYRPAVLGSWETKIVPIQYGVVFPSKETTGNKVGDISEGYSAPGFFAKLLAQRVWRPKYYKFFDSFQIDRQLKPLPEGRMYYVPARLPDTPQMQLRAFYRKMLDAWRILSGEIQLEEVADQINTFSKPPPAA